MRGRRVYVSSTFTDLANYRAKVNERLRRAGYQPVAMEDYPAFDERPPDKCLGDVASCDIYVGILGKRYGHVPKQGNREALSVTELEYRHAGESGIPCLMFLLDPQTPWPEAYDDRISGESAGGKLIQRFRAEVGELHGVSFFKEPEELAGLVLEAISARFAGSEAPSAAMAGFHWPVAWDFTAYLVEKRSGFGGRKWLFKEIEDWFSAGDSQAVLVRADFGVGKTAFLAELVEDRFAARVAGCHFCQHDTVDTLNPGIYVRSLAAQLKETIPGYREWVEERPELEERLGAALQAPAAAFDAAVLNPLQRVPVPQAPLLLVIDALDESLELDAEIVGKVGSLVTLLAAKAGRFPPWLRLLATSRNNTSVVAALRSTFALKEIDAEGRANLDDIYDYALSRCSRSPIAYRLAVGNRSATEIAALLRDRSGGKFLYAVRALTDFSNDSEASVEQILGLPPGMDGFYLDAFQRRFRSPANDYTAVRPLLGVLSTAQEPLPPATLGEILGRSEYQVKAARAPLGDFIVLRQGGYAFDHFSLAEWLIREDEQGLPRAGPFQVDSGQARTSIHEWAIGHVRADTAHLHPYLLRHLAKHLDAAERRQVFGKLLFDFHWLCAVVGQLGVNQALVDCAHLGDTEAGSLLATALRNAAGILRGADHSSLSAVFAGQLLGRLQDLEIAELRALCLSTENELPAIRPALLPRTRSLQLFAHMLLTLRGHEEEVTALAVLPDGRIASASRDRTVRVWDPSGVAPPLEFDEHESDVWALAVLPDGRIASGSSDRTVKVWDPSGQAQSREFRGHEGRIAVLCVLPDGRIASGSSDRTVRVWDPSGRALPLVLSGHERDVSSMAVLPDGRIASGSYDFSVRVWELKEKAPPQLLKDHQGPVLALVVLPDGRIASGSTDRTVRVWEPNARSASKIFEDHQGAVSRLGVLPDGRIVSGSSDRTVRVWDPNGRTAPQLSRDHAGAVVALVVLPDGRIASAASRSIRVWDPRSKAEPEVLPGHEFGVQTLTVLPDGRLVSGSLDCTVRVWDTSGHAPPPPEVSQGHEDWVTTLAVLPDGRIASASDDTTVRIWSADGRVAPNPLQGHEQPVNALAVLPDGHVASASDDTTVRVWDPDGRRSLQVFKGHRGGISALIALPDGRLVSGSGDATARVWDPSGQHLPVVLEGHEHGIGALVALPDGRIASGALDGTLRIWDLGGQAPPILFEGHREGDWTRDPDPVWALGVLPDGRIVSGSVDATVRVWDPSGLRPAIAFEGHDSQVRALIVLPDGRVVSCSEDATVRVWDPSGRTRPLVFRGHRDWVWALAVLPDGYIVSGSRDHSVRVWNPNTGAPVARFEVDGGITCLAAPPSGLIVAGDTGGRLHFLRLCK